MKPVVRGVFGAARIGIAKVFPAMQRSPLIELRASGSRSQENSEVT